MDNGSYNVMAHLNQILKKNRKARLLAELDYPFLSRLSRKNTRAWSDEIRQLNLLAHQAFAPGESLEDPKKLIEWQTASRDSWLVYKEDGVIYGFVHVEPLKSVAAERIRNSKSHEGMIAAKDIKRPKQLDSTDYIHIGSIISNVGESKRRRVALRLLAAIADRVLDLYSLHQGGVHYVLAVDYPDVTTKHHARRLFKRFGFSHTEGEVTDEESPNPVYILDLNGQPTQSHLELEQAVLAIRVRYRYRAKLRLKTRLFTIAIFFLIMSVVLLNILDWIPAAVVGSLALISTLLGIVTVLRNVPEFSRLLKT